MENKEDGHEYYQKALDLIAEEGNKKEIKAYLEKAIELFNFDALRKYMGIFYEKPDDIKYLDAAFKRFQEQQKISTPHLFYAFYGHIKYLLKTKLKQDTLAEAVELCEKSLSIKDNGSAKLHLARIYKNYPKHFNLEREQSLQMAQEYYKDAIKLGAIIPRDELYNFQKKLNPEISFDLINANINLEEFLKRLVEVNAYSFSMLIYGPYNSGQEEFARQLLDALKFKYEEKSIVDFATADSPSYLLKPKIPLNKALIIKDLEGIFGEGTENTVFTTDFVQNNTLPFIMVTRKVGALNVDMRNSFMFKIEVGYMDNAQKEAAYKLFFNLEAPERLRRIGGLVLGDFARIRKKAKLLGVVGNGDEILALLEEEAKFKSGGGDKYLLPDVSFDNSLTSSDVDIMALAERLKGKTDKRFSMLIYGPPGTGKSYYLRYLASELGMTTLEKTAADLFSKYQGEPARRVVDMFREAEDKKAMIILDEVEEIMKSRSEIGESQSWKADMVNAFLTMLENSKCPIACTTNFIDKIDKAALRRFVFKLKFDFLSKEQNRLAFKRFFKFEPPKDLDNVNGLTAGDYSVVKKQAILMDEMNNPDAIFEMLKEEAIKKSSSDFAYNNSIDCDKEIINADKNILYKLEGLVKDAKKEKVSILLHGPLGSGKSVYVKHLAAASGKDVMVYAPSDVIGMNMGAAGDKVASIFKEANSRKAFLVFEDIDSLISEIKERDSVYQQQIVAEFAKQAAVYKHPLVITLNNIKKVDSSIRSKFNFILHFDWLNKDQIEYLYQKKFNAVAPYKVLRLKYVTPSVFERAYTKAEILGALDDAKQLSSIIKEGVDENKRSVWRKRLLLAKVVLGTIGAFGVYTLCSLLYSLLGKIFGF